MDKSLDELVNRDRRSGNGVRRNKNKNDLRGRLAAPYDRAQPQRKISRKKREFDGSVILLLSNLHYNVMPGDLVALVAELLPATTLSRPPTLDYDSSGRSLGTAKLFFSSIPDAELALSKLHNQILMAEQITASIDPESVQIHHAQIDNEIHTNEIVDQDGKYAFKSILDRMGSRRPAAMDINNTDGRGRGGGGNVLDRLGGRVLDRLGPKALYSSNGNGVSSGGGRRRDYRGRRDGDSKSQRSSNAPTIADLDREMEMYLNGDGEPMNLEDLNDKAEADDAGNEQDFGGNSRYTSKSERREFVDYDAPSTDPYTKSGGGERSGRALLDYGDI